MEEVVGAGKVEVEEEEEAAGLRDDGIYSIVAEIYQMLICKVEEEVRREGLLLQLLCRQTTESSILCCVLC